MNWRRVRRVGSGVVIGALVLFLLSPTGCYLSRAGWEEAKILRRRRPIAALIVDSTVDARTRAKLRLVLEARAFAVDSMRLAAKQSFTTFSKLDRDTLVLVLSGAYRDRLKMYTWWFPIVGRVPYKGFFDFTAAKRASDDLARRGFDVHLRPSPAFSTLGWFNDPVMSTSLGSDSLDLADLVIHELTHNSYYAGGQAVFNESFANFAGSRGAAWFFRTRGQNAAAEEVEARWADERLLGVFWTSVYHSLDSAFTAHPNSKPERLTARDTVYSNARTRLIFDIGPKLRTVSPRYAERVRFDNASVMARRIYLTDLDLFDAVYERERRDPRAAVARVIAVARTRPKDPYGALRAWLGMPPADSLRR